MLNAALSLSGFDTGNRHHNAYAAANVVDTFYDFFRTRLGQHVASLNSVTGRPRQFFSSADKGTELNQRQVINMTLFDVDGKSINVHLSAHLIMKSIWVKEKLKNPLHVHCWSIITSNLL